MRYIFHINLQVLSPALADFLGADLLPRTEVVKRIHAHIKDNNLQNPKNKKKILLDSKLQEVFKCKTTDYFKMNRFSDIQLKTYLRRLIAKHVKSADEVV
jgi:chromatin remodeling complex protein RSC6